METKADLDISIFHVVEYAAVPSSPLLGRVAPDDAVVVRYNKKRNHNLIAHRFVVSVARVGRWMVGVRR